MSKSKGSDSQSTKSTPTFNYPGAGGLVDSLLGRTQSKLAGTDDQYGAKGFLQSFMNNAAAYQPNEYFQNYINSINANADNALPDELARTRSQYYRGPAGRNMMALDETLLNNRLRRDEQTGQLFANQYNQDSNNRLNSAVKLLGFDQTDMGSALALAQLLRGQQGTSAGSSNQSGFDLGQILMGAGGLATGVGSFYKQ